MTEIIQITYPKYNIICEYKTPMMEGDLPVRIIYNKKLYVKIPGYPYYYVSTDGQLYSLKHHKLLKIRMMGSYKYPVVTLACKKQQNVPIHKLVALAWIRLPDDVTYEDVIGNFKNHIIVVDHIDHDPSNYNMSNLRWITSFENSHNLAPGKLQGKKGNNNACGRRQPSEYKRWIYMYQNKEYTLGELATELKCSKSRITESFRCNMGLVRMGILTRKQK